MSDGIDPAGLPALAALERLKDEIRIEKKDRWWRYRIYGVDLAIAAVRAAYTVDQTEKSSREDCSSSDSPG